MKTIGLIGAGHIGSQVARLAVSIGYDVVRSNSRGPETLAPLDHFHSRGLAATLIALFRSGEYAEAVSHFYRYAQANPEDPLPHLYMARSHRRLKRYDLAAPELSAAMRLAYTARQAM